MDKQDLPTEKQELGRHQVGCVVDIGVSCNFLRTHSNWNLRKPLHRAHSQTTSQQHP